MFSELCRETLRRAVISNELCCVVLVLIGLSDVILFNGSTALARNLGQTYACTSCGPIYLMEPQ